MCAFPIQSRYFKQAQYDFEQKEAEKRESKYGLNSNVFTISSTKFVFRRNQNRNYLTIYRYSFDCIQAIKSFLFSFRRGYAFISSKRFIIQLIRTCQ